MKALIKTLMLVLLTSCAKYQYFTISSQLPKGDSGTQYFENDTLIIRYSFDRKASLKVEIENKLGELIYVDWEKSAIITKDTAIPFQSNKQQISGSAETIDFLGIPSTDFEGTVTQTPQRSYIPPKAKISRVFSQLPVPFMNSIVNTTYQDKKINYTSVREYNFEPQDSIGYFRSYLHIRNQDSKRSTSNYDHDFWVSRIVETSSSTLPTYQDQFRRETATAAGTAAVVLGAGALIVVAVASSEDE